MKYLKSFGIGIVGIFALPLIAIWMLGEMILLIYESYERKRKYEKDS